MRCAAIGILLALGGCTEFGEDQSTTDAGAPDASGDVTGPVRDAGMAGCKAGAHDFCADFDEGVLEKNWSEQSGQGLMLDTNRFDSPPRSLLVKVPALTSGTRPETFLKTVVAKSGTKLTAAISLAALSVDSPVSVLALEIPGATVSLHLSGTTGFVDVKTTPGGYFEFPFVLGFLQSFRRIELRVSLLPPAKAEVLVDGITVTTIDLTSNGLIFPATTTGVAMRIGVLSEGSPSRAWDLFFDDVTVDIR